MPPSLIIKKKQGLNRKTLFLYFGLFIITVFISYYYINDAIKLYVNKVVNSTEKGYNKLFISNTRENNTTTMNEKKKEICKKPEGNMTNFEKALNFYKRTYYKEINTTNTVNTSETKYILFWGEFFGDKDVHFGLGSRAFQKCPISNCLITTNSTYIPVHQFDAVVFNGARFKKTTFGTPANRSTNQKYVFFSLESPYNVKYDNKFYEENKYFYNWTMTYRRDSDILFPGALIAKQNTNYVMPTPDELKNKTIIASWLVSNCVTSGTKRRRQYVQELQKYIQVDVYGRCGKMNCGNNCTQIIQEKYFFYLAFENSICQDYVTEKVFKRLQLNVVPIVLGNSLYETMLPPYSFINVNQFPNPKMLAEYLIKLTKNLNLYLEYFEWKKYFVVTPDGTESSNELPKEYAACQMCTKLHKPIQYSAYEDIKKWYFGVHCYE